MENGTWHRGVTSQRWDMAQPKYLMIDMIRTVCIV